MSRLPAGVLAVLAACSLSAQAATVSFDAQVDAAAAAVLESSGVPSASVAVIRDDRLVLQRAYGKARLEPPTVASPAMRYGIGSISKQFTAAAVMLLVEQGKLTLDDPVAKYFPALTRAGEVRIRDLLFIDDSPQTARQLLRARDIYTGLQHGTIDRSLFTANGNAYFSASALRDAQAGLAPLGPPQSFSQLSESERGGMRTRRFQVKFPNATLMVVAREFADGRFEQYQLQRE